MRVHLSPRLACGAAISAALLAAPAAAGALPLTHAAPASGGNLVVQNLDWGPLWRTPTAQTALNLFENQVILSRIQACPCAKGDIVHDHDTLALKNNGSGSLTVTGLANSNPGAFRITAPNTPFVIGPGSTQNITVTFIAQGGDLNTGTLTVQSDGGNQTVNLGGFWQSQPEHGQEPTPKELAQLFGFTTTILQQGQKLDEHGLVSPVGDEVLSPYWVRANNNQPILIRWMHAYHKQGQGGTLSWFPEPPAGGSVSATNIPGLKITGHQAQTVLPFQNDNLTKVSEGALCTGSGGCAQDSAFGFAVGAEKSDDTQVYSAPDRQQGCPGVSGPSVCGHHMRFWPVKDASGHFVPYTYYMTMDFAGINYDYNDNGFLIYNITPARGDFPSAGMSKRYDTGISSGSTTDSNGAVWQNDSGLFSPSAPDEAGDLPSDVAFTNDDAIFDTYRGRTSPRGTPITWTIPIAGGAQFVDVRLLFAERYSGDNAVGKRVFSIAANGATYSPGFDIFQQAGGQNRALIVGLSEVHVTNGKLKLTFQASADNVAVNGIEVRCAHAC